MVEDEHTLESLALGEPAADVFLVEEDAAAEEPMVEVPPTMEEPAAEHPTSGCGWPANSQEEDQVEVHAPKEDLDDW